MKKQIKESEHVTTIRKKRKGFNPWIPLCIGSLVFNVFITINDCQTSNMLTDYMTENITLMEEVSDWKAKYEGKQSEVALSWAAFERCREELNALTRTYQVKWDKLDGLLPKPNISTITVKTVDIPIEGTAYDLSYKSCGKYPGHPGYGITATGLSIKGKSMEDARVVAVDPNKFPLNCWIKVEFQDEQYQHMNGWWYTADTGSAVIDNVVDFYFGPGSKQLTKDITDFGRREATVIAIAQNIPLEGETK